MSRTVLPDDILGDIFLSVIVDTFFAVLLERSQNNPSATTTAVRLSAVSNHWRSVALFTPRMWSYITITYGVSSAQPWDPHPYLLAYSLARARNVALSLRIDAPCTLSNEPPHVWDALAEQIMAVTGSLEVTSMVHPGHKLQITAENALSLLLFKPSPYLTRLKYSMEHPSSRKSQSSLIKITDWREVDGNILPYAPLLVDLELKNFGGLQLGMLRPETMRNLRRFASRIFQSSLRIADVLISAPELKEIELGYSEPDDLSFSSSHSRVARKLVSLRGASKILMQLDRAHVPNLHTIHLANEDGGFEAVHLARFFDSTPYLALEHLILPFSDQNDSDQLAATIPLFRYMPNIQTLRLPSFPPEYGLFSQWAHPENVALLPNLRKIEFSKMQLFNLNKIPVIEQLEEAAVIQFLELRRTAMSETCDSSNRLRITVEIGVRRCAAAAEQICELLGRYVVAIRIVGSAQHEQPGSHLLEVRDGSRQAHLFQNS